MPAPVFKLVMENRYKASRATFGAIPTPVIKPAVFCFWQARGGSDNITQDEF